MRTPSFVVNDTQLAIDPESVLTWYGRQVVLSSGTDLGGSAPAVPHNWTWFQLH
ncbi:hypothetical protein BDW71DRAFT_180600 [Aspergillus fruticulosus]